MDLCPKVKNILLLDAEGNRVAAKYCTDEWPTNSAKEAWEKTVSAKTQKSTAYTYTEATTTPTLEGKSGTLQGGEDEIEGGNGNDGEDDVVAPRSTIWDHVEDEVLINSFMGFRTNAITNTNKKYPKLWHRIKEVYDNARMEKPNLRPRTDKMMRSRWRRIGMAVLQWVGCLETAAKKQTSGQTHEDLVKDALKIYRHDVGKEFTLMHCWIMLSRYPKWEEVVSTSIGLPSKGGQSNGVGDDSGKRVRLDEHENCEGMGSSSRPPGFKAAKKVKDEGVFYPSAQLLLDLNERFQSYNDLRTEHLDIEKEKLEYWKLKQQYFQMELELKKEEFKMKKQQMKWDILQRLMDKGSLTPEEETLKNKLLQQLSDFDL